MKLTGTYKLKASRNRIWEALNDPEVLRQCTPGCKRLAPVADDPPNTSYEVLMEIGVASVKGTYTGKIQIADRIPGSQYKLIVTGNGNSGFVRAEGVVQLQDDGEDTLIDYFGQAQVGGTIAGVGQRVIEGIAKLLVGQFFKCFETAVLKSQSRDVRQVISDKQDTNPSRDR